MLSIRWTSGDWEDWTDEIPSAWIEDTGHLEEMRHYCRKGTEKIECVCSVSVVPKALELDYGGSHAEENASNDVPAGKTRIEFASDDRSVVSNILWGEQYKPLERGLAVWVPGEPYEASEGSPYIVSHLRRERDPLLRDKKIEDVIRRTGKLSCEACDFEFKSKYKKLGDGFCEVHHNKPLRQGLQKTKIQDLNILCSNCHRMIHKTVPLVSVERFKGEHITI